MVTFVMFVVAACFQNLASKVKFMELFFYALDLLRQLLPYGLASNHGIQIKMSPVLDEYCYQGRILVGELLQMTL
jgi:hypothetical protein